MEQLQCAAQNSEQPSPGSAIVELLREKLKINQSELARAMNVSRVRISQIISGSAPISPAMALRLQQVSGVAASYWLQLQMAVDLERERRRLHEELQQLPRLEVYVRASEAARPAFSSLGQLGSERQDGLAERVSATA